MNRSNASAVSALVWMLLLMHAGSSYAFAPPSQLEFQLTIDNPDPSIMRNFGWSVANYNDDLLVGSYGGRVYVVDPLTGVEKLRISSPETEGTIGSFGRAITQVQDKIVVGANETDLGPHVRVGSAHIFDGTTGAHLRTLRNPEPSHFGWFGFSIEGAGDKLFVSAESASGNSHGKVHVYDHSTGQLLNTIASPQAGKSGSYGFGFDLEEHDGDLFVSTIGALAESKDAGAVYRFDGTNFNLKKTIANPMPQTEAQFGRSIDSFGNRLLVGAPGVNRSGESLVGEAYLFHADTGALLQTFANPYPTFLSQFGSSVALAGNYAIVAAPGHSAGGPRFTGAVHVFDITTGGLLATLLNPSPIQNSFFANGDGAAITAIGGQIAAGNPFGPGQGQVHLFSIPEPAGISMVLTALCLAVCAKSLA
jgi:hypothetical protein